MDPWVQAAEISISDLLDESPHSASVGSRIVNKSEYSPLVLSELASALATLEISHGSRKKGLKLLRQSLIEPTPNALAQATWLRSKDSIDFDPELTQLGVSAVNEAAAYAAMRQEEWGMAVARLKDWQSEEPFSSFVAGEGSYYALGTLFDGELATSFCDVGLKANPSSKLLMNNRAVGLCMSGKHREASAQLHDLKNLMSNWQTDTVVCATNGLVFFAQGNVDEGRNWYIRAVDLADEERDLDLSFRVRAHWLFQEATRYQIPTDLIDKVISDLDQLSDTGYLPLSTARTWKTMKDKILESRSQCVLDEIVERTISQAMQSIHLMDDST